MLDMIQCTSGGADYARGEWVPADENAGQVLASKGFDAAAAAQAKKARWPMASSVRITTAGMTTHCS